MAEQKDAKYLRAPALKDAEVTADPGALEVMKERGGDWAAYQCVALDSYFTGHVKYLRVGKDCTFANPPTQYPTGPISWSYIYAGMVDLETGSVG